MKHKRRILTMLLAALLVLESFAVTALATAPETEIAPEPATVPEEMLSAIQEEPAGTVVVQEEMVPVEAAEAESEAEILYSGTCGDNLIWTIDRNGVLVISGKGEMIDFPGNLYAPWASAIVKKIIVEPGVTSIGSHAFECSSGSLANVKEIILPDTLLHIGKHAFRHSPIEAIYIPNSVKTIDDYAFWGCTQLKTVHISKSVGTQIGVPLFFFCKERFSC